MTDPLRSVRSRSCQYFANMQWHRICSTQALYCVALVPRQRYAIPTTVMTDPARALRLPPVVCLFRFFGFRCRCSSSSPACRIPSFVSSPLLLLPPLIPIGNFVPRQSPLVRCIARTRNNTFEFHRCKAKIKTVWKQRPGSRGRKRFHWSKLLFWTRISYRVGLGQPSLAMEKGICPIRLEIQLKAKAIGVRG
jgi:hypothetical protein